VKVAKVKVNPKELPRNPFPKKRETFWEVVSFGVHSQPVQTYSFFCKWSSFFGLDSKTSQLTNPLVDRVLSRFWRRIKTNC